MSSEETLVASIDEGTTSTRFMVYISLCILKNKKPFNLKL